MCNWRCEEVIHSPTSSTVELLFYSVVVSMHTELLIVLQLGMSRVQHSHGFL